MEFHRGERRSQFMGNGRDECIFEKPHLLFLFISLTRVIELFVEIVFICEDVIHGSSKEQCTKEDKGLRYFLEAEILSSKKNSIHEHEEWSDREEENRIEICLCERIMLSHEGKKAPRGGVRR